MEDIAAGIGILLAILGPLLLIPVLYLIYRLVTRPLAGVILGSDVTRAGVRFAGFLLACVLTAAILAVTYFPGKFEFDRLCSAEGAPEVVRRVRVDGYWREPLFPYLAREILARGTFRFVEGRHAKGDVVRYVRSGDGLIRVERSTEPQSRYAVRQTTEAVDRGVIVTRKRIYERSTDRELATAATLAYDGGPLSILLGSWGMSSCPDPRSAEGRRLFRVFYHLEDVVLGGGPMD